MTPEKKRPDARENPDVEISARVKTRKLRFEEEPETKTRSWGSPEHESVSGTELENLPEKVRSGVIYRNSTVRFRLAAKLVGADHRLEGGSEEA